MFQEFLLKGMEAFRTRDPLDGPDLSPVDLDGQDQTGVDQAAIQ